jgi:hypothetical protein
MSDAANRINQGLREALVHAKGENFLKFVTKNSAKVEATPLSAGGRHKKLSDHILIG